MNPILPALKSDPVVRKKSFGIIPDGLQFKALKLLPWVQFFRTPEGVLIRNKKGSFLISGANAYPVFFALKKYLDGKHKIKDFLPQEKKAAQLIFKMLQQLIQYKCLKVIKSEALCEKTNLTPNEAEIYHFLSCYIDNPGQKLQHFKNTHFVCVGTGFPLLNLVLALNQYGANHITLMTDKETQILAERFFPSFIEEKQILSCKLLDLAFLDTHLENKIAQRQAFLIMAEAGSHYFEQLFYAGSPVVHFPVACMIKVTEKAVLMLSGIQIENGYRKWIDFLDKEPQSRWRPALGALSIASHYAAFYLLCCQAGLLAKLPYQHIAVEQATFKVRPLNSYQEVFL